MGTDDFHFKRKQKKIDTFKRQQGQRKPNDVVLIVCEGKKTEPNYLKGLREHLHLNPPNIDILPCLAGTDPMSIVNFAIEKHKQKDYDRIYCVFDKEHTNYKDALNKIESNFENGLLIYAIPSVPCFEYWLLLHFKNSAKPYQQAGKKSAGDQLKSEIKKHIENYHEADKDIFEKTKKHLETAIVRAKQIDESQIKIGTDNPSTKIYELVEYLQTLTSRNNE